MTPQLQQAIKLLQLSNIDLQEYVDRELEQNPLLDRAAPETAGEVERYDGTLAPTPRDAADGARADHLPADNNAPLDADYENVYDPESAAVGYASGQTWQGPALNGLDADDGGIDRAPGRDKTLREHLGDQLALEIDDAGDRLIGQALIDALDESGYIASDLEAFAEQLNCPVERVVTILETLQGFDPPGVFARNLAECLELQLRDRNRFDPAMAALLQNLELVARRDWTALRALCGVDAEDLADMVGEIRALNPKPASVFDEAPVQTVVPDVLVRRGSDGSWLVELNSETLPRLLVDRTYFNRVNGLARKREDRTYITERLQAANWLIKSLDQRANTILKVASELVLQQGEFLEHGIEHLRPLTLRDIAEAIGMHESTVSRVTNNKYMATPRGVHEMKYFFTSAIAHADGGAAHSAESVRHRIKTLIDREDPDAVLSDDRIVKMLKNAGIDIARRTVAKYRESLNIPSSAHRRRLKMAQV